MLFAAGLWVFTIGYAVTYTGISWFLHGSSSMSLGQALGISTSLQPTAVAPPTPTPNGGASSQLPSNVTSPGSNLPAGTQQV